MIVYAASDLHGNLLPVPDDADLLLLPGDICPDFRPPRNHHWEVVDTGGLKQAAWLQTDFSEWLEDHGVPTVLTWGNHDYVGENLKHLVDSAPLPSNLKILVDQETEFHGLRVYGTPWVPYLQSWAFYGDKRKLNLRAEAIPEGLDFLMTHGPPYGAGDLVPGGTTKQRLKYRNHHGAHAGDSTLNKALKRAKPAVTLCGHIHEDRGAHWCEGQRVYNVAAVDENYKVHSGPWRRFQR